MKLTNTLRFIATLLLSVLLLVRNLMEPFSWPRGIVIGLTTLSILLHIVLLVLMLRDRRS